MYYLSLNNNQIMHIGDLVANSGFGEGDVIEILNNPLSRDACRLHIQDLEERGVIVKFYRTDCLKKTNCEVSLYHRQ